MTNSQYYPLPIPHFETNYAQVPLEMYTCVLFFKLYPHSIHGSLNMPFIAHNNFDIEKCDFLKVKCHIPNLTQFLLLVIQNCLFESEDFGHLTEEIHGYITTFSSF